MNKPTFAEVQFTEIETEKSKIGSWTFRNWNISTCCEIGIRGVEPKQPSDLQGASSGSAAAQTISSARPHRGHALVQQDCTRPLPPSLKQIEPSSGRSCRFDMGEGGLPTLDQARVPAPVSQRLEPWGPTARKPEIENRKCKKVPRCETLSPLHLS